MAGSQLPSTFRRILVKRLGTDFRKATEIVRVEMIKPGPKEVLIKNRYVGINASDINMTAGRYSLDKKLPFGCGLEGLGDIVQAGSETSLRVGQPVIHTGFNAFTEYLVMKESDVIPVPKADPALISLIVSGLTASIGLEKEADLQPGKTVLVTAAAGGTGQFAVQLAKAAGCHVVGTCSNPAKVEFLKSIGCDRPINYKVENLKDVLAKEYPNGIDVVYESVGKDVLDASLLNLARFGRLIVIGMISSYDDKTIKDKSSVNIPMTLLSKSASMRGFFLLQYRKEYAHHVSTLLQMYMQGKLKITLDRGAAGKPFLGLEGIADAIDYMYSGKNLGKVVVNIADTQKSSL